MTRRARMTKVRHNVRTVIIDLIRQAKSRDEAEEVIATAFVVVASFFDSPEVAARFLMEVADWPSQGGEITAIRNRGGYQMKWQPIETAPRDGTDVLVCVSIHLGEGEWDHYQWVDWQRGPFSWPIYQERIDIPFPPTHWMPLPEPPEGDE